MRRHFLILLVAGAVGCAGKASVQPSTQPSPQVSTATPNKAPAPQAPSPAPLIPLDSNQVSEIARDVNVSSDSAADEAVLDQLAVAEPNVPTSDDELPAVPVSWDIDVTTWGDHERVQFYLNFFEEQAHPRFQIWIERMPVYEPMIRQKLQAADMPTDLVYLALIESGFSNSAMSRTRAVGMWQFMPRTGKEYGLRIDSWVDERRDPVKSTNAALAFLSDLYQRFGSLYLAAAAYNAGGGKVVAWPSARPDDEERTGSTPTATFFRLYDTGFIRRETKDYVPKLIAAARIAKEPARYGFQIGESAAPDLDSMVVPDMTGLDVIARLADTPLPHPRDSIRSTCGSRRPRASPRSCAFRPGARHRPRPADATLPAAERVTFAYYTAKKGDTPSLVSQHYGVPVGVLYEANPWMRSGSAIKAGRQVVVPTGGSASVVVARQVSTAREPESGSSRGGYHTVRKGQTLGGIAKRYRMSTAQLKSMNNLSGNTIRVGQKLRVSGGASRSTAQVASRDHAKGGGTSTVGYGTVTYKVRRGDTLSSIAKRHGVTIASIQQINNLSGGLRSGTTRRHPEEGVKT